MRALIMLILILSTALQAVSISDYFREPTQQEVQQYYQNKANNPGRYTYNPLQVGNKWYYSGWYSDLVEDHPIYSFCDRQVTADSLINNVMHYYVTSMYTFEHFWECNRGDSLMSYGDFYYLNPPYADTLFWVFTPGATFLPYWYWWEVTCQPYGLANVFGQTVMVVYYSLCASNVSLWAEVFGPLSHGFDFGGIYLDGCIINGVTYGIVPNDDEYLPSPIPLNVTCYPNPFSNNINIKLESSQKQSVTISLHNIKGQHIRTWNATSPITLTWDGRDSESHTLSPGVYFLRAIAGKTCLIKKILKID